MKKLLSALLLAVLMTASMHLSAFADTGIGTKPGLEMPDFTAPLTDGTTITLSEVLEEKDLVVLNIFASWCKPCESEFPEMEKVYEQNQDRMEIIALSMDPDDTMQMMADYKTSHGLTFPMGLTEDKLDFLNVSAYPTTLMIDRDGRVGFIKVGSFGEGPEFGERVNYFLSPDYDGTPIASEEALNIIPILAGLALLTTIFTAVGRWGIFRKAGKKGWYSLIPFLSSYTEYDICWKGWIGLVAALLTAAGFGVRMLDLPDIVNSAVEGLGFALTFWESLQLAKVFGKGKVFGVLMALPLLKSILRLVLGMGRAGYQAQNQ